MNAKRPAPDAASYLEDGAGDCELRSVAFAVPNVQLSFYDPYYDRAFFIALRDVNFFYFASNHIQNVIARIYCFASWNEAMLVEGFAKLAGLTVANFADVNISSTDPVLYIEPITGGDLITQYKTMTITPEPCF